MLPKKVLPGNARLPFPVITLLLLFVSGCCSDPVKHRNHKNISPSTDPTLRNVHESRRRAGEGSRDPEGAGQVTCGSVKYAYSAKGFLDVDVPEEAISGDHLKICQQGLTCCTDEMEYKLSTHSRAEFDSLLKEGINDVRTVLSTRTQKFDEFFRELLKTSKKDFHQMFLQTYGLLYERNSYIFTNMFQDLERYYMTGAVDLSDALNGFFHRLYQKMFEVLNAQYTFDEKYLQCISEHMDQLKPFGDVPKKLTIEVKRSFIATRTFVQALSNGKDVVKNVMEVGPSMECSKALMKMTYCPHCQGLADLKPCGNYCINVMKGCLAHHAELDKEWNNYIEALLLLANRLETSFNIESVVDPIDIKISEAIMNFQENGMAVSQRLFDSCGKPKIGKTKREAKGRVDDFDAYKFKPHQAYPPGPPTAAGTNMDQLIQDIKKKIKRTKGFWTKLPEVLCSHEHVAGPSPRDSLKECWNGSGKALYESDVIGDGLVNQRNNPEVNLDTNRQNAIINQQILTLKLITTKLSHAYNGLEVEWQDTSETDWASGSGSGSGDDEDGDGDAEGVVLGAHVVGDPKKNVIPDDIYFQPTMRPSSRPTESGFPSPKWPLEDPPRTRRPRPSPPSPSTGAKRVPSIVSLFVAVICSFFSLKVQLESHL